MPRTNRKTERPLSAAYLNVADLVDGFTGFEVRAHWIVRYAPDNKIRRYLQDSIDRFERDMHRPSRHELDLDDGEGDGDADEADTGIGRRP